MTPASPSPESHFLARWLAAVRNSGALSALSPDAWQTLCALLSFRTRDGRCVFMLPHLAYALGLSEEEAWVRLEALAGIQWGEEPLVSLEADAEGAVAGATLLPLEWIEWIERILPGASEPAPSDPPVALEGASQPLPSSEPLPSLSVGAALDPQLYAALEAAGLYPDQIERLLSEFPEERVRRQLGWLPARRARNPAAYLVRAIEEDWAAPREGR